MSLKLQETYLEIHSYFIMQNYRNPLEFEAL